MRPLAPDGERDVRREENGGRPQGSGMLRRLTVGPLLLRSFHFLKFVLNVPFSEGQD